MMKKNFAIILMTFSLSSCIFYPKIADEQVAGCELVTKQLTIDLISLDADIGSDPRGVVILAAFGGTTLIVSGSIMVAGNSIHWLEREGTCDDGVIKYAISSLAASLQSAGGCIVNSKDELLNWIIEKKGEELTTKAE